MRGRTARRARPLLVLLALAIPAVLGAQDAPSPWQGEGRVEAIVARATAVHVGVGLSARISGYVRAGVVAGAGVAPAGDGRAFDARVDAVGRFLFDPYRQHRRAPYAVGGASGRWSRERWRGYLVVGVGMEGPVVRGMLPALEIGLGGGVRVGVVLRAAPSEGR